MSEPTIRLQKFLADAGLASRRTAEVAIAAGEIWVNGKPAELGCKIDPLVDRVTYKGKTLQTNAQPKLTLAVHKPRGLICSNNDPHNPETIFSLLPRQLARFRFFCAGRLDKDSEGLVILTTDGDLSHRLMHPASEVVKRYAVRLKEFFPASRIKLLLRGVIAEGERLKVEHALLLGPSSDGSSRSLDVHLHHGKKREIRLLFLALGYEVKRLRRYQIGALRLRGIPLRGVKQLSPKEIELLFENPSVSNEGERIKRPKKKAVKAAKPKTASNDSDSDTFDSHED